MDMCCKLASAQGISAYEYMHNAHLFLLSVWTQDNTGHALFEYSMKNVQLLTQRTQDNITKDDDNS